MSSTEIFFDEADDATELVKALTAEGYAADLRREAFAGEDDAEDHAWVLVVSPSDARVVEMVDVYGGWMPGDDRLSAEGGASDLPDGPKRFKKS